MVAPGLEAARGPAQGRLTHQQSCPAFAPCLSRALTSTLHWQLEPVIGEEGLCTPSLARSHTA